jgi:hypothetical protein
MDVNHRTRTRWLLRWRKNEHVRRAMDRSTTDAIQLLARVCMTCAVIFNIPNLPYPLTVRVCCYFLCVLFGAMEEGPIMEKVYLGVRSYPPHLLPLMAGARFIAYPRVALVIFWAFIPMAIVVFCCCFDTRHDDEDSSTRFCPAFCFI